MWFVARLLRVDKDGNLPVAGAGETGEAIETRCQRKRSLGSSRYALLTLDPRIDCLTASKSFPAGVELFFAVTSCHLLPN